MFTICSLWGAESNGLGLRKLRRSLPPFFPNRTRALPPKLGDDALLDGDLYTECHLKRRFVLVKAQMTAVGPYVVIFRTLSRLVLVRESCDTARIPNQTLLCIDRKTFHGSFLLWSFCLLCLVLRSLFDCVG